MPDTAASNPHKIIRERYAIFEKNGTFGMIALAITPVVNAVSRFDPREKQNPTTFKSFETEAQADHWFEEYKIATVTDNAWRLAYSGPRNFG